MKKIQENSKKVKNLSVTFSGKKAVSKIKNY